MLSVNKKILLAISFMVSSCGRDDEVTLIHFDQDIAIITRISGSGGALSDETYRLFYRYKGKEKAFFEGTNPKSFNLTKTSPNKITVKFCDGNVHFAQPIFPGPQYKVLIHLDLDMAC